MELRQSIETNRVKPFNSERQCQIKYQKEDGNESNDEKLNKIA